MVIKFISGPAQLDEIISEAKKAKAAGKQYKFDYNKFFPDYENPFQPKKPNEQAKDRDSKDSRSKRSSERSFKYRDRDHERSSSSYYKSKQHFGYKKEDKYKWQDEKVKKDKKVHEKHKTKNKEEKSKEQQSKQDNEESFDDKSISDFYVCDSWSLETDEKGSDKVSESENNEQLKREHEVQEITDKIECKKSTKTPKELHKLHPVNDSFKFEIDDDPDLDMFDDSADVKQFAKPTVRKTKQSSIYDQQLYDPMDATDISQSSSVDDIQKVNEESFLESVINEIKHERLSDDELSQEKAFLVEYDNTPEKRSTNSSSSTPDLDFKNQSVRSDYSEGYKSSDSRKSVESDHKSLESGYRSTDSGYRLDTIKNKESLIDFEVDNAMSRATMESLETWSFVLKICQPILFRHDRDKCFR